MPLSRSVSWALGIVLSVTLVGTVEAADKWLVRQKQPSPEGQWVLYENGRINRGDPSTSFDQRENCGHGKSANCNGALDLTGWRIAAQGGSNQTDNFFVTFTKGNPNYTTGFESAQIFYNLRAGGVVTKAVKTTSYQVTEQAKADRLIQQGGFTAYNAWRNGDGSFATQYRNAEGSEITAHYTASGGLKAALVDERQQLAAEQVNAQPYYGLPIPSCQSVSCSGFDASGNITKEVTTTYDGRVLR